jgi:hypothetical protein
MDQPLEMEIIKTDTEKTRFLETPRYAEALYHLGSGAYGI